MNIIMLEAQIYIYIPDNYTLDNISDNEPYTIYVANVSDRIFSGRVVKLRYYT